jgi:hypothetical protein
LTGNKPSLNYYTILHIYNNSITTDILEEELGYYGKGVGRGSEEPEADRKLYPGGRQKLMLARRSHTPHYQELHVGINNLEKRDR